MRTIGLSNVPAASAAAFAVAAKEPRLKPQVPPITSLLLGSLLVGAVLWAAAPATPLSTIASLATDLSNGDAAAAIGRFDSSMPGYGKISQNIDSLGQQAEVSCAIDIVSDTESGGVHTLDLDWIMTLKAVGDNPAGEQRREQVKVEMRQFKGAWKITAMSPLTILDPIHIG
jgi:hypothetical protein